MRKIVVSLLLAFAVLTMYGQTSAIFGAVTSATVKGTGATNFTLPSKLFQEYDYSYQVIPALYGAGDSLNTVVELYQSNSLAGSWTEITSAQDTLTATAGKLIEGTNAAGLLHRITCTGISTDTVTVTVYYILKLDKEF